MIGNHLSWGELNRLADDELDNARRGVAKEHVAACLRCRDRLAYLAALSSVADDIRHPSPPHDLIDDVLESRARGERVILPGAVGDMPRRRWAPAVAAAVAIGAVVGVATFLVPTEAGAGASELRFDPPTPVRGESVEVTYRPSTELAGQDRLVLRVRHRPAIADEVRETSRDYREVTLLPTGDGTYEGTLERLDAVVYEQFSVASVGGVGLDDRNGRLFDLLSHDDGRPELEALLQRFRVEENRDWPAADATLTQLTTLYPEHVEGWSLEFTHRQRADSPEAAEATAAKHRKIFRDLQRHALSADTVTAADAAALARYASELKETEAEDYWYGRLAELDPLNRRLISHGVFKRLELASGDPIAALDYLERMWATGARGAPLYENGLNLATLAQRPEAVRTWARRGLDARSDDLWRTDAALALVAFDQTRSEGLREARHLIARQDSLASADRPLDLTIAEHEAESYWTRSTLRIQLAQELMKTGDPSAALRELDAAAALGGWQPDVYRTRFEARLAVGDTAGATVDLARLQVDPILSHRAADSLLYRLPESFTTSIGSYRAKASAEMLELTLRELAARSPSRPLPEARVLAASGAELGIRELVAGHPTIIALWDRRLVDAEAGDVRWADERLRDRDGQLLWITPEAHSEALLGFARDHGLTVPCYQDADRSFATALGEWSSHIYLVIDRTGLIRSSVISLIEAIRLLEILEQESRATA